MALCTKKDVENELSEWGALQATDDNQDGSPDASALAKTLFDWAISKAEVLIMERIGHIYAITDIVGTDWGKYRGAFVSACCLLRRLGRSLPDGMNAQYTEFMAYLKSVALKELVLPGVDVDGGMTSIGCSVSNFHMDPRFLIEQSRVIRTTSVGPKDTPGVARRTDVWESIAPDVVR